VAVVQVVALVVKVEVGQAVQVVITQVLLEAQEVQAQYHLSPVVV
jgi:hypothetical protein